MQRGLDILCFLVNRPFWTLKKILKGTWPSDIPLGEITSRLGQSPVILEAGAGFGTQTKIFAECFPKGKIYAFEPVSELYEVTKNATKNYPNVTLFNSALAEKNKNKVNIRVSKNRQHESSTTLKPNENFVRFYPKIDLSTQREVDAIDLETVIMNLRLLKIDLLWLDLQGAELQILKDAESSLGKIVYIYLEVANQLFFQAGSTKNEVERFMVENQFEKVDEAIGVHFGNMLFRNKSSSLGDFIN